MNFTPPDNWLKPNYAYHIEINKDHHIAESNRDNNRYPIEGTKPFDFKNAPALDVVVVPIIYQPYGFNDEFFPIYDFDFLTEYPEKLFPIPAANYQFHQFYIYRPKNESYNLDKEEGWSGLLDEIVTLQDFEDPSGTLIYYGLVNSFGAHDCAPTGCTVGVGNQGSRGAVGWTGRDPRTFEASNTMTHELGHNFNRKHVLCTGSEDNIDKNYPYPGGSIGVWGLDIEERKLIDPTSFFDFMGYCPDIWTSDYTYRKIFQFRDANLSMGSGIPIDGEAMYIRGTLSPEGEATLLPLYRQRIATISSGEGPYAVDVLGDRGQVLGTFKFEMIDIADAPGYRHFGFFVPDLPGTAGLRLREGERILVEKIIQPGLNQLQAQEKALVVDSVGDRLQVSWPELSHLEELAYYRVRLSNDGGTSWQVLALDWRESSMLLPEMSAVEGNRSLLEIQASDGIHTSTQVYPIRLDR